MSSSRFHKVYRSLTVVACVGAVVLTFNACGNNGFQTMTDSASTIENTDGSANSEGNGNGGQNGNPPGSSPNPTTSTTMPPTTSPTTTTTLPTSTIPTTTTTTLPKQPGALISIEQVIADQTAPSHEASVIDIRFDWQKRPQIIMQSPSGQDIPSWFEYSKPQWCTSINSWMQAFEAQGNAATNSRVQYKNLRVYLLSEKTRKWTRVDIQAAPYTDTWKYPYAFAGAGGSRPESSGGVSVKPKYPNFVHGYGKGASLNGPDVRAVFAAMEFRLILDNPNGTDDRAKAKYLINPGADYWGNSDWTYAPGVGMGKMLLAKPEWRTGTMLVPNGRYGATYDEMKTNPPPLDAP